jgi:hypothetical protein
MTARALTPRFTLDDMIRASDEWGANCGPGALAAILGLTLDDVRPAFAALGFEAKRYTNPSMMFGALNALKVDWRKHSLPRWPTYGLARIQWEGPWTAPGVPMRVRYRHTHWVGSLWRGDVDENVGVFDINALANGSGWSSLKDWRSILVPWLLEELEPKASGSWHITHAIEVAG